MILSILIPSIPEREGSLNTLIKELQRQFISCHNLHPVLGEIEILSDTSKKFIDGGLTVGAKRDKLLNEAHGKYICFLDDDETIAPNYIETLLRLCAEDKDVCCFRSLFKCDTYWAVIDMDLNNHLNEQATPHRIVNRTPWHICPIKRGHALQYSFEDINNAEDWLWMQQVLSKCITQAKSTLIIHQYNHSAKTSAVDEIERQ